MRDPWLGQRQAFHDAANWLTVLLGHLEMLREEPGSVRHLELARRAARSAHRLCALPPGGPRATSSIDAARHADRAVEHLRPAAIARQISLETEFGDVSPVAVDAPGLDDALLNLLRNALEATPGGGKVSLVVERGGPGFVRIQVRDQGPGIPPGMRAGVGRPGHSAKQGVDRGLGLSRVRNWLAEWGTDLEIGDAPGGGAAIGFTLATAQLPARSQGPSGCLRVLLVEDDVAVAEVLSLLLATDGHRVDQVGDVTAAEGLFAPGAFDLALCDQHLPDGTGEDLALRLMAEDPALACFLVTGAPESVNCSGDPRLRVLAKPVSRDDLRRAVADAVQTRPDQAPSNDA